mmetsp:Transcript_15228/g.39352  ORF Transcript_15228/g.39352 Transcript_15228/m.39352 type:complete len:264 (+) Transcript_15228:594-1385(+)
MIGGLEVRLATRVYISPREIEIGVRQRKTAVSTQKSIAIGETSERTVVARRSTSLHAEMKEAPTMATTPPMTKGSSLLSAGESWSLSFEMAVQDAPMATTKTKSTMRGCLTSSASSDSAKKVKTGARAARHCCSVGSSAEMATFVSARSATDSAQMTTKTLQIDRSMGWKLVGCSVKRIISQRIVIALETAEYATPVVCMCPATSSSCVRLSITRVSTFFTTATVITRNAASATVPECDTSGPAPAMQRSQLLRGCSPLSSRA